MFKTIRKFKYVIYIVIAVGILCPSLKFSVSDIPDKIGEFTANIKGYFSGDEKETEIEEMPDKIDDLNIESLYS